MIYHSTKKLMFKITELEKFFKQNLITDLAILNKWESFSKMVDKWYGPPEDCIISPWIVHQALIQKKAKTQNCGRGHNPNGT